MTGAGATKTTFAIDALVILLFQLPVCLVAIGVFGGSLRTLFTCVAVTNVVSAVAYALVYAKGAWVRAHGAITARVTDRPPALPEPTS